jgi:hypothetical protein
MGLFDCIFKNEPNQSDNPDIADIGGWTSAMWVPLPGGDSEQSILENSDLIIKATVDSQYAVIK